MSVRERHPLAAAVRRSSSSTQAAPPARLCPVTPSRRAHRWRRRRRQPLGRGWPCPRPPPRLTRSRSPPHILPALPCPRASTSWTRSIGGASSPSTPRRKTTKRPPMRRNPRAPRAAPTEGTSHQDSALPLPSHPVARPGGCATASSLSTPRRWSSQQSGLAVIGSREPCHCQSGPETTSTVLYCRGSM